MDLQNLYPDSISIPCGFSANQFSAKCTNTLNNLTQSETMADSYFLGYALPSSLPVFYNFNVIYDNLGTSDSVKISQGTPDKNFMVGYSMNGTAGSAYCFMDQTETLRTNDLNTIRLPNDLYPEFFGLRNVNNGVSLSINAIRYHLGTTSTGMLYKTFTLTYSDFEAFMRGDYKLTYNDSGIATFQFSGADFTENDTAYFEPTEGYGYRLWLFAYHLNITYVYNGSYVTPNVPHPYCFVKISSKHDNGESTVGYRFAAGGSAEESDISTKHFMYCRFGENHEIHITNARLRAYGMEGYEYTGDDFPNPGVYYTFPHIVTKTGVWCYFYNKYSLHDVEKMIALQCRITVTDQPSYHSGFTFAPNVDANNKFTVSIKTGNLSDENFKNGLRRWQYVDIEEWEEDPTKPQGITNNEFVEEDAPPYDPTPPTPPGEEGNNPDNPDAGLGQVDDTPADQIETDRMNDTRTVFGANAFITQYVLTLGQIISLGQYLWSSITDPNSQGLKNFVTIFSDTGTFNAANCLQCFVSLKVFPFDMFNTVYSNTAPDLRAGSGYTALLAESVTVFSSCTYSIDCGSVDVTADGYNIVPGQYDFRNYINTTVCVFLPFCGTVELNPADVFGYTLSCMYYIDVSSGTCTACVFVERQDGKRLMVASKSGQIGFNIPMSATNAMQVAGTFLSDAASAAQTISDTVLSLATSRALGSIGAPVEDAAASQQFLQGNVRATSSAVGKATSGIAGAISGLGNMMSRSGCAYPSLSGGTGMAALFFDKTPYVVIRRSNYSSPNNYAHTTGFSTTDGGTEHKSTLGAYAGWTVVKNCDLKNIHANREELDEIKHLLETGVFL